MPGSTKTSSAYIFKDRVIANRKVGTLTKRKMNASKAEVERNLKSTLQKKKKNETTEMEVGGGRAGMQM